MASQLTRLDNNEMKLTKPAMARMARPSQLISVLDRQRGHTAFTAWNGPSRLTTNGHQLHPRVLRTSPRCGLQSTANSGAHHELCVR